MILWECQGQPTHAPSKEILSIFRVKGSVGFVQGGFALPNGERRGESGPERPSPPPPVAGTAWHRKKYLPQCFTLGNFNFFILCLCQFVLKT